jgi:hypothetical protein
MASERLGAIDFAAGRRHRVIAVTGFADVRLCDKSVGQVLIVHVVKDIDLPVAGAARDHVAVRCDALSNRTVVSKRIAVDKCG